MEIRIEFCEKREKVERPGKGRSILGLFDRYVALDLETTGLDPVLDEIIEVCAIRYEKGAPVDRFETLVKPEDEIDEFITELTGITNEMVAGAPTFGEVAKRFLKFVGNDIIVGHNISFDIAFLYDALEEYEGVVFGNDYVDTMRMSRRLFPEEKHHRLEDLRERLLSGGKVEHRASSDAECAAACYEALKNVVHERGIDSLAKTPRKVVHAADITTERVDIPTDTPIFGRVFVFTGTLNGCTRKDAMQMVVDRGGICGDGVTVKTNFLVLGAQDYVKVGETGKSSKQRKAEKLQLGGQDIQVISESVFLSMIAEADE